MDDLKFRRSIYVDPSSQDPEILDAIKSDTAKQKFAQEVIQLDEKIIAALDVPVPEDLYNKLILRQTLKIHQRKRKTYLQLASAASIALVFGLLFNYVPFYKSYNSLGEYSLAHVYHEINDFHNDDQTSISLASLNEKVATFNGEFTQSLGQLISSDYCNFKGLNSLHLVFKGKSSPVTVFIIPNNDTLNFSGQFNDDKLQGQSQRIGQNDVVIIGDKNESINEWQNNITRHLQWST